jgi:nucleotide-binding universal stress UspA family protein
MLVTAILGPLITTRAAARLTEEVPDFADTEPPPPGGFALTLPGQICKVVVPVHNPKTERYLLELASLVARHESGELLPLTIAQAQAQMDSPQMSRRLAQGEQLLTAAQDISLELGVKTIPQLRIEYDVAQGISHASREANADLIVLGFSEQRGWRSQLFSNIADQVLWSAHCLVAIANLHRSPLGYEKILVPVENFSARAMRPLRFARILAEATQAHITLLHVCQPWVSDNHHAWIEHRLSLAASQIAGPEVSASTHIISADNVTSAILQASHHQDVVLLRSRRRRVGADGLAIGAVTTPLLQRLRTSFLLLGEPHADE